MTNHGSIDVDVTIDGVVNGTVQEGSGGGTRNYERLTNKPQINDVELVGNKSLEDLGIVNNVQPDWEQDDTEAEDYIKNKPEIPSAQVQSDWNEADNTKPDFIKNKPDIPPEQVNSDWNAVGGKAQILNKPTIPSVVANPGNTTENLTSIGINGTNYAIQGGGGGGAVNDVKVNETSVVDSQGVANIDLTGYATTSDIPTDLADLQDDSTHRLVTDTEKAGWDDKADTSDIPTVNNSTIIIQKNGQNVDTFTLNQNTDKTIDISVPTKTSDLQNDSSFITNTVNNLANYYLKSETYTKTEVGNLLDGKVDKVTGKGLSTNDYDNTAKGIVDSVTVALADKVDKVAGKGLSTNDYTTAEKNKVATIDNKADKVSSATNGNLAGLNGSGNLTDSGWNGAKDTTSISDNPISISGLKSNQLAINPVITFEPIQTGSGTPSPVNERPISGYDKIEVLSCGVNVWDEEWEVGSIGNQTGQNETDSTNIRSKDFNVIKPATTYYCKVASGYIWIHYYDANKNWISGNSLSNGGGVFTVPNNSNIKYFRIRTTNSYGSTYRNNIGINYPATETSYVASNKTTDLSLTIGQTVYGGTLDVRTGKLTGDYTEYIFTGNETWESTFAGKAYSCSCLTSKPSISNAAQNNVYKCEIAEPKSANDLYANQTGIATNGTSIFISADLYVSISSFTGKKVIYKGTNSFTIQLTPHEISLLKDYAYVSTNGTNIALDYHNGELASLADVSQLGETVNTLLKYDDISSSFTSASNFTLLDAKKINGIVYLNFMVSGVTIGTNDAYIKNDLMSANLPNCVCSVILSPGSNTTPIALAYIDPEGRFVIRTGGTALNNASYIVTAIYRI